MPVEKDSQKNDVTPSREEFMKKGSRRVPGPSAEEGVGKDIQCTALITDLILTAEELGSIKKNALVNRKPAPSCVGRHIQGRSLTCQKIPK